MASSSSRPPVSLPPAGPSSGSTSNVPPQPPPSSSSTIPRTRSSRRRSNTSSPSPSPIASSSPKRSDPRLIVQKLQHENQTLKRKLVQYANTLEQVSGHAKREISSSAKARDSAIAAAADAAALRQKAAELSLTRDRSDRAIQDLQQTLTDRTTQLSRSTDELSRLRSRVAEVDADKIALRDARDAHAVAERRALAAEAEARTQNERVLNLEHRIKDASDRILAAEKLSREMADVAKNRDELAQRAERSGREIAAANQRDVHTKQQIIRLKNDIERMERGSISLRDALEERGRSLAAAEERVRMIEREAKASDLRRRETENKANESVNALRKELDAAMKQITERNSEIAELRTAAIRDMDATGAVEERDQLRITVRDLQEELEQSTEMLTRAAIDALSDKSRIRKLEDALNRLRDEVSAEKRDRSTKDAKIAGMTEEITSYESQLDALRDSKRSLTDECHGLQIKIHEKDALITSKVKELEKVGTEKKDRAFHADRLSLDLSNAKNSLAKKESDHINLSAEHSQLKEQLDTVTKEGDKLRTDILNVKRELTNISDELITVRHERDRLQGAADDLGMTKRQLSHLNSQLSEKDEEINSTKQRYSQLKNEAADSVREKKRLSDMLAEVSADLQRANHELDLLRGLRKEQEALVSRISQVSETSTREMNVLKQVQTEQAERLAKNTVDEYERRMQAMQMTAKEDIANTVADQLRHDIMPHLIHVVDTKAKYMVHALARHVESFTLEDGGMGVDTLPDASVSSTGAGVAGRHTRFAGYDSSRRGTSVADDDLAGFSVGGGDADSMLMNQSNTNIATASGSTNSRGTRGGAGGLPSSTAPSGSESAYRTSSRGGIPGVGAMASESGTGIGGDIDGGASTAESRWASVLEASRIDDLSSTTGDRSGVMGCLHDDTGVSVPSRTETPTEGRSEIVEDDATGTRAFGETSHGESNVLEEDDNVDEDEEVASGTDSNGDDDDDIHGMEEEGMVTADDVAKILLGKQAEELETSGSSNRREVILEEVPGATKGEVILEETPSPRDEEEDTEEDKQEEAERDLDTTAHGEEEVEELDITENNGQETDDDDEDMGVDIEVEFDPRELLKQGVFNSMMENLVVEDDDDDDDYEDEDDEDEDEDEDEDRDGDGEEEDDGQYRDVRSKFSDEELAEEEEHKRDDDNERIQQRDEDVQAHKASREIDLDDGGFTRVSTNEDDDSDPLQLSETQDDDEALHSGASGIGSSTQFGLSNSALAELTADAGDDEGIEGEDDNIHDEEEFEDGSDPIEEVHDYQYDHAESRPVVHDSRGSDDDDGNHDHDGNDGRYDDHDDDDAVYDDDNVTGDHGDGDDVVDNNDDDDDTDTDGRGRVEEYVASVRRQHEEAMYQGVEHNEADEDSDGTMPHTQESESENRLEFVEQSTTHDEEPATSETRQSEVETQTEELDDEEDGEENIVKAFYHPTRVVMMERGDDNDDDVTGSADVEINKEISDEGREVEEEKLVDDSEDNHFLEEALNRGIVDDSKSPLVITGEPGASTMAIAPASSDGDIEGREEMVPPVVPATGTESSHFHEDGDDGDGDDDDDDDEEEGEYVEDMEEEGMIHRTSLNYREGDDEYDDMGSGTSGNIHYRRNIAYGERGEVLDAQLMEPTSEHGEFEDDEREQEHPLGHEDDDLDEDRDDDDDDDDDGVGGAVEGEDGMGRYEDVNRMPDEDMFESVESSEMMEGDMERWREAVAAGLVPERTRRREGASVSSAHTSSASMTTRVGNMSVAQVAARFDATEMIRDDRDDNE